MNATLDTLTNADLDAYTRNVIPDNSYATVPMDAVQPTNLPQLEETVDEEEVYVSFEKALSNRLASLPMHAMHSGKLAPLSTETLSVLARLSTRRAPLTEPLYHTSYTQRLSHGYAPVQRLVVYFCLAFILMMLGFDAMGLLIVMHIL